MRLFLLRNFGLGRHGLFRSVYLPLILVMLLSLIGFLHDYIYGDNIKIEIAAQDGDLATVKELIQAKPALVSSRYYIGTHWTPLHVAAVKGHTEVVAFLMAHGADVNARDTNGKTPLDLAMEVHNGRVTEMLIQHGGVK